MTRSYGQFCPLARTLDRVGDRWTLLIVRDVAFGPKRYSDLLAGLPGIGTILLGERLRRLEPRTSAARGRGSITGDEAAIRRFMDVLVRRWPPGPALTS